MNTKAEGTGEGTQTLPQKGIQHLQGTVFDSPDRHNQVWTMSFLHERHDPSCKRNASHPVGRPGFGARQGRRQAAGRKGSGTEDWGGSVDLQKKIGEGFLTRQLIG